MFFVISLLGAFSLLWLLGIVSYRLFLSPLAGIPGPNLAAVTFWYEFYYDVIKGGRYTFKIKSLHKKYGPIIRINPYEIHVDDPEFYDQVYVGAATRKTDKWWWSADMFQVPSSVISSIPHDLHRRRRAMFANFFSVAAVHRLESLLRQKVTKLSQRLEKAAQIQEPVSLTHAYAALTIDIITSYTFGESFNYLEDAEFKPQFYELIRRTSSFTHFVKQFPRLVYWVRFIPAWLSRLFLPNQAIIIEMQSKFARQVEELRERKSIGEKSDADAPTTDGSIFEAMLQAHVPESEKSTHRLSQEAVVLNIAGMVTTARTLEVISWYLLKNPAITARLREELFKAQSSTSVDDVAALPLNNLESIQYLTAIIREGLRISYGVPHRLQRVSPDTYLQYQDYSIPPGTPVSMSSYLMHDNTDLFPEPKVFKPERWLPLETTGQHLNKYLVPFSKGTRQCVGMNLAWAELYLTIAAMFGSKNQMELYHTDFERDIDTAVDGFNPLPSWDSQGLRIVVQGSEE